jgi:hypothetical protein
LDANGVKAIDANDFLIFNTDTGSFFYDADGSATKAAPIQIAIIGSTEHPALQASDFGVIYG